MLRKIILKILEDVDEDIKQMMLEQDNSGETWQLLADPAGTIIALQRLRNEKLRKK